MLAAVWVAWTAVAVWVAAASGVSVGTATGVLVASITPPTGVGVASSGGANGGELTVSDEVPAAVPSAPVTVCCDPLLSPVVAEQVLAALSQVPSGVMVKVVAAVTLPAELPKA